MLITDGISSSKVSQVAAGQVFEGLKVLRPLHSTHRSHVYLVEDLESGARFALKIPSIEMQSDQAALGR